MKKVDSIVVKPNDPPIAAEVMEQAIVEIAAAMRKLSATRLKRETVVILVHARSKVAKRDVEYVLNCLDQLESIYLKPKTATKK